MAVQKGALVGNRITQEGLAAKVAARLLPWNYQYNVPAVSYLYEFQLIKLTAWK